MSKSFGFSNIDTYLVFVPVKGKHQWALEADPDVSFCIHYIF